MNNQKYFQLHPEYQEFKIPEYTLHKLRLVVPSMDYASESLSWVSDKEVGKYMGADFSNVSLEGEEKRLKKIINDTNAFHWFIECDGKIIGDTNINEVEDKSLEFGVKSGKLNCIIGAKNLWGKGIGTATQRKVLEWAFASGGFEIVKSRAVAQNKASHALLRKLGFIEYGKEDYDGPDFGEPTFYITYKLIKEEWNKSAA